MSPTNVSENNNNKNADPYAFVGITRNTDGSLTRSSMFLPDVPPRPEFDPTNPIRVLSKDIPINQEKNTWARVYLPGGPARLPARTPLVVYIHGGGFILGSAATSLFHKFCNEMAAEFQMVLVSVEYRLAPEHRLPAAYDDCMEALDWIKSSSDEWLVNHVDFSKSFLMGSSAGGNIVYHMGLRAISCVDDLEPVKIRGLILHQPFFGGVERTPSEIRLANGEAFPLVAADLMWDLGLPVGADRDHEYCNSTVSVASHLDLLEKIKDQGWKVLVIGYDGDLLIDRQVELARTLKEKGIDVVEEFSEGGFHGVDAFDESRAKILYGVLKDFLLSF